MHATAGLVLFTVSSALGFGAATALQSPQGKDAPVAAAGAPPRLADILKGYVGQDCWPWWKESGLVGINFDSSNGVAMQKRKIVLVGQDFLKLDQEVIVPYSCLSWLQGKKL